MKKNLLLIVMAVTGCMMISSCVSKKELLDCQTSYNTVNSKYQDSREALASANARIQSLQEQLNSEKANSASLQKSLKDMQASLNQSLAAANSNNVNVAKLVDQVIQEPEQTCNSKIHQNNKCKDRDSEGSEYSDCRS